jgi:hypothetical protein
MQSTNILFSLALTFWRRRSRIDRRKRLRRRDRLWRRSRLGAWNRFWRRHWLAGGDNRRRLARSRRRCRLTRRQYAPGRQLTRWQLAGGRPRGSVRAESIRDTASKTICIKSIGKSRPKAVGIESIRESGGQSIRLIREFAPVWRTWSFRCIRCQCQGEHHQHNLNLRFHRFSSSNPDTLQIIRARHIHRHALPFCSKEVQ